MTTTVLDSVNGHDAADGNPYVPVEIVAGKVGNAVQFNGAETSTSRPYISIPHDASFNASAVSFSCWVKIASKENSFSFLSKLTNDYGLSYDAALDRIIGTIGGVNIQASTFGSPVLDTWLFVVVTSTGASGNIQINNGTADTESAGSPSGTNDLIIGAYAVGGSFGEALDDLRFFADVLSAGEITTLYNNGSGSASAVGDETHWWTFNALVDGVYPDTAGSLDATPNGVSISSVSGKLGNAVSLLSIDPRNWLSVADSADLRANGHESFSFVFWLKILAYPTGSRSSILFKTDAGDSDYQIDIYNDGTLGFYMAGEDSAYPEVDVSSMPLNTWTMITAIFEYGIGLRLQINLDTPVSTSYLLGCMANSYPEPLIYGRQLNGEIDELYFCKRVLTTDEIAYFYNSGSGRALFPAP